MEAAKGATGLLPPQRAAFIMFQSSRKADLFSGEEESVVQQRFTNDNYDAESTRSNIGVGLHDLS